MIANKLRSSWRVFMSKSGGLTRFAAAIAIAATAHNAAVAQGFVQAKYLKYNQGTATWVDGNAQSTLNFDTHVSRVGPISQSVQFINNTLWPVNISGISIYPSYGPITVGTKILTAKADYDSRLGYGVAENSCLGRTVYPGQSCSFLVDVKLMYTGLFDYTNTFTYTMPTSGNPTAITRFNSRINFSVSNAGMWSSPHLPPYEYVCQGDSC